MVHNLISLDCEFQSNPAGVGSVFGAKSRQWFEFCFVPLVPMSSKHVWMCSICQWQVPIQQGYVQPTSVHASLAPMY